MKPDTMTWHSLRWLLALWLSAACASTASAQGVEAVQACMRANVPPALQVKQFTLAATDRNQRERIMKGRLYAVRQDGLVRSTMRLDEPADMRGAAYLLREARRAGADEMYVYLPALNKVRRVVGGSQDSPLFGSDISYADIKQINQVFTAGSTTLEGNERLGARETYVLSLVPAAAEASRFRSIRAWIDRQACVALKVEFHDAGGLRKRYTTPPDAIRQAGPYWYVSDGLMEDVVEKTQTRLTVDGVSSPDDVADRYFSPQSFHLGG